MKTKEIISELNGCEVLSLQFEGVVGINNGVVTRAYDQETMKMTPSKWKELWDEYIEYEL